MYITQLASAQLPLWNMLVKQNIDPAPLFHNARVDPALMYEEGARHSEQRVTALWQEVQRQVKDPCFGLSIASNWHPSHIGTLGYALLMSRTLRETMERLIRFNKVLSDISFGRLHEDRDNNSLSYVLLFEDESPYIPMREDATIAWLMSLLRMNYQQNLAPLAVDVMHEPDYTGNFFMYYQSPVNFRAKEYRLSLSLDIVDELLPAGNKELAAFNDQLMTKYLSGLDKTDLVTRVKKAIVERLPSAEASVERIASDLYMGKRTLQRMLLQKNTSFITLLNEARMELAMQYVSDSTMDLSEVAFLLGYSELSAFSRSFRRWLGESPARYRAAVHQ